MKRLYLRGFGVGVVFAAIILSIVFDQRKLSDEQIKEKASELGMYSEEEMTDFAKEAALEAVKKNEIEHAKKGAKDSILVSKEEPKQEEIKQEEPKKEEPKQEEPKKEEPKQEEPKQEQPKKEEPKQKEPKQEEPKKEEPKPEESKKEEQVKPEEPEKEVTKLPELPKLGENDPSKLRPGIKVLNVERGMFSEKVSQRLADMGLVKSANDFNNYITNVGKASRIKIGTFEIPDSADYDEIVRIITE